MRVEAILVVLAVGCGSASFEDCAVICSMATGSCPVGMSCRASGFCVSDDHPDVCGRSDARPPPDGIVDAAIDGAIDGPACGVPESCQGAAVTCPGASSCYALCGNPVDQVYGSEICASWGGTLVIVDSDLESACLEEAVDPFTIWIDLVQRDGASDPTADWTWSASDSPFRKWGSAQPDDEDLTEDGAQQCAIMVPGGLWDDESCGSPHPFACERQP